MKFFDYTDCISEGDLVIIYISADNLKQITVRKDQVYQTKHG